MRDERGVHEILLVAAPAGAGESAFIRQLRAGLLPKEIHELLPEDCAGWSYISERTPLAKRLSADLLSSRKPARLLIHYDLMRPYRLGFRDYRSDPALALVWCPQSNLIVITLSTPAEALIAQYIGRAFRLHRQRKGRLKRWLRGLRLEAYRLTGSHWVLLGRKRSKLVSLYARGEALRHWFFRWEEFLAGLYQENAMNAKQPMRLISVTPCVSSEGEPSFCLPSAME
jgi:hypothetical protein